MEQLTLNITAAYQIDAPSSNWVSCLVCMVNEIKVEEMLNWCPSTNSMIGLCWEHSGGSMQVFSNINNAHVIFDDLATGQVHIGTEVGLT